jgi:hypothetical protein
MDTTVIKEKIHELEQARIALHGEKKMRDLLNCNGHQMDITVTFGSSYRVRITEHDRGYREQIKRGYEMVQLGLIKMADKSIDIAQAKVCKLEQELITLVNSKKPAKGGDG